MNEIVISAENIGKRYRLGGRAPYKALRDTLATLAAAPLKLFRPHSRTVADNSDFWALKDVSFAVKRGEVVGVIGRNGAGKSTLLKILSRITEPTEGRIELRGRVGSLLEVGTGFHPELTGRENIYLNGAILGMKRAEIRGKFDEIVAFSEIEKFLDTPVKHYSSGMYMRLAFSVAAHLEPEILLVDEVLAVGDAEFQKKCLGKMSEVAHQGRTVLFVSHNMPAVSTLCNRGILLDRGGIRFDGPAGEAVEQYLGAAANQASPAAGLAFAPAPSHPYCDTARIHRCFIREKGGSDPVAERHLFASRQYEAGFDVEIFRPNPNLVFFVSCYTADDELVFVSDIHDTPDAAALLQPGRRTLAVPLPVHVLAQRGYQIELTSVIHYEGWLLPPGLQHRLAVSVFRDGRNSAMGYDEMTHPYTGGRRPGLIVPDLKWSASRQQANQD